ncbi:DUF779 domain-containing protein [Nakamurella sp. YIM 132084]|uniref:DUF779 domain-containing protein n=2 Tax=Nakamurella leprariae TaxID=2803911 RepID=A0A938YAJ6_9ACTN|nr:DUF779 domain-containing protein [Nakamurella leprariae]MBM9466234.1 DUF779 domain-containing protein [Nakamurella leprariae]
MSLQDGSRESAEAPPVEAPAPTGGPATRVAHTEAAADLLRRMTDRHGPLMFHQSGGCCDGSSPMCYPLGDFITSDSDVRLGDLVVEGLESPVTVWMSASQFEYWRHTHLTIDVVPGRGSGFSVEAPEGVRFLIRSRLLTDEEVAELDARPVA